MGFDSGVRKLCPHPLSMMMIKVIMALFWFFVSFFLP